MRWKKIKKTKWRRVFVFWPKGTMDGFKVSFCRVWKRTVPIEDEYGLSLDSYVVDEYHTNPDGLEDEYQNKRDSITQIQIGGNNSQCIQSDGDLYINGKKYEKEKPKPKRPPKRSIYEDIWHPRKPPPPPSPPPIRVISEDVNFTTVLDWLDKHKEDFENIIDKPAKEREAKNKEMLAILKKRKARREAKDIMDNLSKRKKISTCQILRNSHERD